MSRLARRVKRLETIKAPYEDLVVKIRTRADNSGRDEFYYGWIQKDGKRTWGRITEEEAEKRYRKKAEKTGKKRSAGSQYRHDP